jgi:hypothetical protein
MAPKKKCFVIMPFSKTTDVHDGQYWQDFFDTFLAPALEIHGYGAEKSVDAPNNITKQIIRELAMADLVLAVLTDDKPNVFYELGVRHSLRQGTIMILEGDKRPFDISNYGILPYERNDLKKFTVELGRYIKVAEERNEDSPVADFLNQRITVSVNLAIGRLRQCVQILKAASNKDFHSALNQIRELQQTWKPEREQVTVVSGNKMVLHVDPATEQNLAIDEWWRDEMSDSKSLYPMMQERKWGFRIAQIKENKGRLTAIAFETVDNPNCIVIAEAHYYQENKPY